MRSWYRFPLDSVLGSSGNIITLLTPYPLEILGLSLDSLPPGISGDPPLGGGVWIFSGITQCCVALRNAV